MYCSVLCCGWICGKENSNSRQKIANSRDIFIKKGKRNMRTHKLMTISKKTKLKTRKKRKRHERLFGCFSVNNFSHSSERVSITGKAEKQLIRSASKFSCYPPCSARLSQREQRESRSEQGDRHSLFVSSSQRQERSVREHKQKRTTSSCSHICLVAVSQLRIFDDDEWQDSEKSNFSQIWGWEKFLDLFLLKKYIRYFLFQQFLRNK